MTLKNQVALAYIKSYLQEDLGRGDHTSRSIFKNSNTVLMRLIVKDRGLIAGMKAAPMVFKTVHRSIRFKAFVKDGQAVQPGDCAFEVEGPAIALLSAERLVLNIMQRMSGIATQTHRYTQKIAHTKAKLLDTRKTTPGFRYFEKWAVAIGGGQNHRFGLYDMILIKDNHIDAAGGIEESIKRAQGYLKQTGLKLPLVVEARSLANVQEILKFKGIHRILLDNFSVPQLKAAVQWVKGRQNLEASGGVNLKTVSSIAETGVNFISVGALTHQIKSLDLSLKIVKST